MEEDLGLGFARKYRPTRLQDYVGNESIKRTIKRYLSSGKRPQSILLTGNTGCGKTTIARLLVKEYLCEDRDGETGACGKCYQCEAVDEYIKTGASDMLSDVVEIDISEKSRKNDIDSILETIEYPSVTGGWKVYILDEVHLASQQAQGRLLKCLEEPPEKVLIVFCTTDPQKMLDTLKNRCQLQLTVTKPGLADLVKLLKRVCLEEGRDYEVEGLRAIARRSDFVIREALNTLERVLETRGDAKTKSVSEEFSEISDNILFEFYRAYLDDDYLGYTSLLYRIKTEYDFNQFLVSLSSFTVRGIYIMNGVDIEGISESEIKSYSSLFSSFSSSEISNILSQLKKMDLGDVEVNLMAFMYCKNNTVVTAPTETPVLDSQSGSTSDEAAFRNRVLSKKENDRVLKGNMSLQETMREVSVADMSNMFSFEKVSE